MSPRNSRGRLAADHKQPETGPEAATTTLDYVVPTEFVDLPSRGRFYPEGHPLHGKDSIEIRFMTAKEEDILTNRSLLKKGVALEKVLQNIIVEPGVDSLDLLIGDRNALIVAARRSAYGAEYNTRITCPGCFEASEAEFDLNEFFEEAEELSLSDLGVEPNTDGTFDVLLPTTKATTTVRLLSGRDEKITLSSKSSKGKKSSEEDVKITEQFKQFIVSVNGITDKAQISDFIQNMPAKDSRFLRTMYSEIMPNVNNVQDFECPSCGYEQETEVPFTSNFFWPKS